MCKEISLKIINKTIKETIKTTITIKLKTIIIRMIIKMIIKMIINRIKESLTMLKINRNRQIYNIKNNNMKIKTSKSMFKLFWWIKTMMGQ